MTLNGAIQQLKELRDNELMPVVLRPWFDKPIETIEQDAVEVKYGEWIVDTAFGNDVMSDEQMVICSECGKGIFWGKQNYCPNCGALMMDEVLSGNR